MFNRANRIFSAFMNHSWTVGLMKRCNHETPEHFFSALFVSKRYKKKGMEVYPVLLPDLDYDFVLENWDEIKRSASMRRMDFRELLETTTEDLKNNIRLLKLAESNLEANVSLIRDVKNRNNTSGLNQLASERLVLYETFWHYENSVVGLLLKRPNLLHAETGRERKIISRIGNCDSLCSVESHMDLGRRKKWLLFPRIGPGVNYMIGELALLELAIIDYFQSHLRNEQYRNISAPNIVQTAIIEACGKNPHDPNSAVRLKGKKDGLVQQYLVGSATLEALTAFITRIIIPKSNLPMQLYSVGRHYSCQSDISLGLYGTGQSTRIECLAVCEQSDDMTRSFDGMVDVLKNAYEKIGIPFQVVIVSAEELKLAESKRIQLEVWSPVMKQYVPCSSVSMYSDYLSKRLMIQWRIKDPSTPRYTYCAGATAVSVPVLVASVMENMQQGNGNISIPKALQPFIL